MVEPPTLRAQKPIVVSSKTDRLPRSERRGCMSRSTAATSSSPVGIYPITVSAGTLASDNYTFVFVDGTLTVYDFPSGATDNLIWLPLQSFSWLAMNSSGALFFSPSGRRFLCT